MTVNITYAATFSNLVDLSIDYLANFSSEKPVIARILDVIDRFENTVSENPESVHLSPHLSSLGLMNYREFIASGFRILYRFEDHSNTIKVVVFCCQKQDLPQILFDYCLLYK